ncbi:hypothetical protein HMPREF9074_09458 [Capnocytophaga sp. oral taxon 329 str. F0087]|nr:hypothetical protein HMPREF9074_09458 [Capnocytophaga sp. oral taxon 329 str. F0087]
MFLCIYKKVYYYFLANLLIIKAFSSSLWWKSLKIFAKMQKKYHVTKKK